MNDLFLCVVNMSLTASVLGAAVLALRAALKRRLPRRIFYLLWALVLARLLIPVSISSPISVYNALPAARAVSVSQDTRTASIAFLGDTGASIDFPTLQLPYESQGPQDMASPPPQRRIAPAKINIYTILSTIWACGFCLLLSYGIGCYLYTVSKIRRSRTLTHTKRIGEVFRQIGVHPGRVRLYVSDLFASPVVCGLLRPRLVLSGLVEEEDMVHVIAHELTHIKRRDNFYKAFATLALYIHWFNPLIWMFYRWYVTDMEASCDEAVIFKGNCERTSYAYSLVNMAQKSKNAFTGGFLAFGECALKERVVSIMNAKKNTVLLTIIGVAVVAGLAIVFLTNPQQKTLPDAAPPIASSSLDVLDEQAQKECDAARALLDALDAKTITNVEITGFTVTEADYAPLVAAIKTFELEPWSGIQKPDARTAVFNRSDGTSLMFSVSGDRLLITQYGLRADEDRSYTCRVLPQSLSDYNACLDALQPIQEAVPPAPPPPVQTVPAPSAPAVSQPQDAEDADTGKEEQVEDEEPIKKPAEEEDVFPALNEDNPPYLRLFPDDVLDVNLVEWKTHTACTISNRDDIRSLLAVLNSLTPEEGLHLTPNDDQLRLLRIRLTDGSKYDYWCYSNVMVVEGGQVARFPQLEKLYDLFYATEKRVYGAEKAVAEWLGYMNPYRITSMRVERLDNDERVTDDLIFDAAVSGEQRDTIMRVAAGLQSLTVHPDSVQSCAKDNIRVPQSEDRLYNIYLEFENGKETYNIRLMNSGRVIITTGTLDYALLYKTTGDGTFLTLLSNLDAIVYAAQ